MDITAPAARPTAAQRLQKKVREARFFYRMMNEERDKRYSTEPDAVEYFLNGFLAAAKSVTSIAISATDGRYETWVKPWVSKRSEEDQRFLKYLIDQRNTSQHQGNVDFDTELYFVPIEPMSHDVYTPIPMRVPGTLPSKPQVARRKYAFRIGGQPLDMDVACKRYLELLELFVENFIASHPAAE